MCACGCKKKKIIPITQPKVSIQPKTAKIVIVEGEVKSVPAPARPPDVLTAPTNNVEHIVNKLNNILKPKN